MKDKTLQKMMDHATQQALNIYGSDSQILKFASECGEASAKAIDVVLQTTKLDGATREEQLTELVDEIADVLITANHVTRVVGLWRVNEAIQRKILAFQRKMENDSKDNS